MKNNALWYLSPIAFALLSASWITHSDFNNGTYDQSGAARTIQSTSSSGNVHCVPEQVSARLAHELDENLTASTHPTRVANGAQCPRT